MKKVNETFQKYFSQNEKIKKLGKSEHSTDYIVMDSIDKVTMVFRITNDNSCVFYVQPISTTFFSNPYNLKKFAQFIEDIERKEE